jgi:peptide/nickel transport system permease protein
MKSAITATKSNEPSPKTPENQTPLVMTWRQLKRHKLAVASFVVFAVMTLACVAAPLIAPYEADAIDLGSVRQAPSGDHWMGTDDLGRDLYTRILYGGRVSVFIGVLAALVGTGFGTLIGAFSGFFGGWVDNLLMRFTDITYSIPSLPLLIVLSAYSQAAVPAMVLIIGLLSWMATARVVRAQVLTIKEMEFIQAAIGIGSTNLRVIARHVVPNAMGPIVVGATLAVGNAIIIESSLSFLGLGVQPPTPTWGNMLMDSQATMATKPWLTIFPGLSILLTVLAVNFIGDGLQDSLDPTARTD